MKIVFPTVIFLIVAVANAAPPREGFPERELDVTNDNDVRRFYGPWPRIRRADGEYVDYRDYGAPAVVQEYSPSNEDFPVDDPPIVDGPASDFQSNYGEVSDDGSEASSDQGGVSNSHFQSQTNSQENGNRYTHETESHSREEDEEAEDAGAAWGR